MSLSQDQIQSFRRSGVILLPNYFTEEEVALLQRVSSELGADAASILNEAIRTNVSPAVLAAKNPESLIVVPEVSDPRKVCRFEYIIKRSADLQQLVKERLLPVLAQLGGEPFVPFKDKENEKHAGGGAFPPHQDYAAYQYFDPKYQITAGISIDPCTALNGCLQFAPDWLEEIRKIPGAVERVEQGRPLLHWVHGGKHNGDILPSTSSRLTWKSFETSPRDLVFFDSFVPHYSEPNRSDASRRLLILTFSPARFGDHYDKYYTEKRTHYNDPKFHVSTPTNHATLHANKL